MIRHDIERVAIIRELRSAAVQLESRAYLNIPQTMRDAADELESLPAVISKRKLKRHRKERRRAAAQAVIRSFAHETIAKAGDE